MNPLKTLIGCLAVAAALTGAHAQEQVLNLYSARHYAADESLYADFTRKTGIRIRRIEGREEELIERISNEGANSPADVFITVDAARLARAKDAGITQPHGSALIAERSRAPHRPPMIACCQPKNSV